MTEPTQAHLDEAARLAGYESWREVKTAFHGNHGTRAAVQAHARTLADFEAHKRTVSDVVSGYNAMWHKFTPSRDTFMQHFGGFMIREPADPLADALVETFPRANGAEVMAQDLRQALAKRGLKIVEDNQ